MKTWLARAFVVLLLGYLSVAYLSPAFDIVWNGQTDRVMSDGTDAATLPYQYATLREIFAERPRELFYGAVPTRHLNPPQGFALWIPWGERWIALFASSFTPIEHVSTVFVGLLFFINALCMYGLCRELGWSRGLALALAIAWAFCPFTRARAQVHAGLAGTYHVPLAFLSALWAVKGTGRRSLMAAAAGFLFVAMAPHYFVITLAFLSPFVLAIIWSFAKTAGARPVKRLMIACVPMILLLGWCYLKPLPADMIAAGAAGYPPSGKTEGGGPHSFLTRFAAHPVDYFTGDLALGYEDWNFLRSDLSREVLGTLGDSNAHERANGIRWVVWLLVLGGLLRWPCGTRKIQVSILVFGLFAFWLSLSPAALAPVTGPSYWLYSLISQIRVPSRAGIYVHFAALLFAGLFVHEFVKQKKRAAYFLPAVLPLLMIADLPPYLQEMSVAAVRPQLKSLVGENCGAGIYFPYVAGNWGVLQSYYFLQEMRGTHCDLVNRQWPDGRSEKMFRAMGLSQGMVNGFNAGRPEYSLAILKMAECAPLSFIVFDPMTEIQARTQLCAKLGWQMTEERVCKRAPLPLSQDPAECL